MRSLAHTYAVDKKQVQAVVHAVLLGGGTRAFRAKYKARGRGTAGLERQGAGGGSGAGSAGLIEGRAW
jgi:hypothetical protein